MQVIEQILELARWAPSGDNTQPWRFEITGDKQVVVHGYDTRRHCVYDFDGRPSQISLGALLETMRIAASAHGLRAEIGRRPELSEEQPTFDVSFQPDPTVEPSPLLPFITSRAVQRWPMSTEPLTSQQRLALEASVGADYRIAWFGTLAQRWTLAKLLFANAKVRLTTPEAFEVHRSIIEWDVRYSEDRIPAEALGLDPMTTRLMRWAMSSWARVDFLNTYLAGTLLPRLQLDLLPSLACASHFLIVAPSAPKDVDDFLPQGPLSSASG
jgi:hypothetical protein